MITVHAVNATENHDDLTSTPLGWIRSSAPSTTTSIYHLFKELVPNSSGEQPPCDGCGSGERIKVRGEPVVQAFSTYVIDQCIIDLFRAKMASLRYREVEIPSQPIRYLPSSSSTSFQWPKCLDATYFAWKRVFRPVILGTRNQLGHLKHRTEIEPSPLYPCSPSRGELFSFQYYPLEPAAEPKPLASVIVLPTGSVCWNDFQRFLRKESDKWFTCRKNLPLLERLDDFWHSAESCIVLTDEFNVQIIHKFSRRASSLGICGWSAPLSDNATPWRYRYGAMSPIYCVQGALNCTDPSLPTSPIAVNKCPTCFLDFDHFTMQRHPPDFDSFLDWKESIEEEVLSQPLNVGDELTICPDGFIKRSSLLPCFLPLEKLSSSTLEAIMKRPRSRHVDVDHILTQARNSGTLHLFVTKVVRSGRNKFSQVVFGRLRWTSVDGKETSETKNAVCLKMFDEALFPVPSYEAFEDDHDCDIFSDSIYPNERLLNLHFTDDMMRREYAVYNRLEYLQGTLLPHAYGFHEVTLPTGRMVNGFLMEIAIGHTLGSLPLEAWPESAQTQLVRRLRQGHSALRYGGVDKGDWHLDQIILKPVSSGTTSEDTSEFDIVFIDFAFTQLCQGIVHGFRIAEMFTRRDDLKLSLLHSKTIPRSVVVENWPEFDDYER